MKQTFTPSKQFIGLLAFGLFIALGLSFNAIFSAQQLLPSFVFIGYTLFCLYSLWTISRSSISVDDEGLWSSRQGKTNSLVKWQQIAAVHTRGNGLLLYNHQGKRLLKLLYNLNGFNELYESILAHITLPKPYPTTFKAGILHHAEHLFFILIFPAIFWLQRDVLGSEWRQWIIWVIGLLLLHGMFLSRYLREIYRIEINDDIINLYYPLRHRAIPIANIENVEHNYGSALRTVVLTVKNRKKTIELRTGNNPLGLYSAIKQRIGN